MPVMLVRPLHPVSPDLTWRGEAPDAYAGPIPIIGVADVERFSGPAPLHRYVLFRDGSVLGALDVLVEDGQAVRHVQAEWLEPLFEALTSAEARAGEQVESAALVCAPDGSDAALLLVGPHERRLRPLEGSGAEPDWEPLAFYRDWLDHLEATTGALRASAREPRP